MNSLANRVLIPFLLFAALVVVTFNTFVALHSVRSLVNSQEWVAHTWQVITEAEKILSSVRAAETGNRGYLLTGNSSYLAPYDAARRDLPAELDHFQQLTTDNPTEQARVLEMRSIVAERLSLLEQSMTTRQKDRAVALVGSGQKATDRLRALADASEAEEQGLLATRITQAKKSAQNARIALAISTGLDVLLIAFMLRYFFRERAMRLAAELTGKRLAVAHAQADQRAEEVRTLNATLELRVQQRTAELESLNSELEAFSYSVSHDLRAPLRTIDGFSLALAEDYDKLIDETGRDYIRRVRNGVQRMGQLIDALLQLSRITRADLVRQPFSLTELANSVAEQLCEQDPGRALTLHIEPGLTADADPRLTRIALENLLGNAVKFSSRREQSIIDFGWDQAKSAWFVRDNGAGFDVAYADKLFSAFNRLHGDKDFKGSGIGLATVARVVLRHQGRIWADSILHHGATFWFNLGPASQSPINQA